jgi:uncharacterized membrane protein
MLILDFLSRVVHVGTAITLVGGSLFMLLVLMPSAKELDDDAHQQLAASVVARWKRLVHIGVLLFLVSGIYNYMRAIPNHRGDGVYHALLGIKMILALGVFFLAAALVGRSSKLQPIRDQRAKWLKVMVTLAAIIVAISGFVKVRASTSARMEVQSTDSFSDQIPANR